MEALLNQGWLQRLGACDRDGNPVPFNSRHAEGWCLMGALFKAAKLHGGLRGDTLMRTVTVLCQAINLRPSYRSLWTWNDMRGRRHSEVIAALTKAKTLL